MILDAEANVIEIVANANGHLLFLGKSGYGKTYSSYRKIEDEVRKGQRIMVLDYSGSFSEQELLQNRLEVADNSTILDPMKEHVCWQLKYKNEKKAIDDMTDALISSWGIGSYAHKKLLRTCMHETMSHQKELSIGAILAWLEAEIKNAGKDFERLDNLRRLRDRVTMNGIATKISFKVHSEQNEPCTNVMIVQLSDMPENEKAFYSNLLLELVWKETVNSVCERRWDRIVLDEIQHLSRRKGSVFSMMMTEGRKKKLSVLAITQYLSGFTDSEVEDLWQADGILIFRQTPASSEYLAKKINSEKVTFWTSVLSALDVGEFVLLGKYTVNNKSKLLTRPIICMEQ